MVKILVGDVLESNLEESFDSIFDSLPKCRKDRVNAYKCEKDKVSSLLASKLLLNGLTSLGFEKQIQNITADENGKPYIPGDPIYFSISHSGTKALAVFSDCPIGCDIQFMDEKAIGIADHFFNDSEIQEINNADDKTVEFFKYWTLKESYMKLDGRGLSVGIKNILISGGNIAEKNYESHSEIIDKNYMVSFVRKII